MENINLDDVRNEIDNIDEKIVKLIEKRFELVVKVAIYKKNNGKKIFDEKRELEVINKNVNRVENKELNKYIKNIIQTIMDNSKEYQKDIINNLK